MNPADTIKYLKDILPPDTTTVEDGIVDGVRVTTFTTMPKRCGTARVLMATIGEPAPDSIDYGLPVVNGFRLITPKEERT